jgi:hypothetical protein
MRYIRIVGCSFILKFNISRSDGYAGTKKPFWFSICSGLPSQLRNGANEKPEWLFYFSNHNPDLVKAEVGFSTGGTFFLLCFCSSCFFLFPSFLNVVRRK